MAFDYRNLLSEGIGETVTLERSPLIEGFVAGAKAALIAAPLGAAFQALKGKSAVTGALVAGLGAGLLAGGAKGGVQKLQNMSEEERLRYHVRNMMLREPRLFQPRFSEGFNSVYPKT